ncbi:MAG: radical SAM family heme chaperone HemW [Desulfobacterales bacterium]
MTGGIYIHVPFCIRKCPYCDFYSTEDISRKDAYKYALIREIRMRAYSFPHASFDTIYIGGGTPTTLEPTDLEHILEAVHLNFSILPNPEITIEANPGTVTQATLKAFKTAGINRINIGVQSFNDASLSFLGRIHSSSQAAEALDAAQKAGFENVGLDLIYGLPDQNKGSWQKDLTAAAAFCPSHISCYMLTLEPGTKMAADKDADLFTPLCEDRVSAMFIQASKFLSSRGYEHYEISNFASSKQARSMHNQKYWVNSPYIGFGPSAHSYIEPERFWNTKTLETYISLLVSGIPPTRETEHLTATQLMLEAVYLGLRRSDGINITEFENRFKTDFKNIFAPSLDRFTDSGHMLLDTTSCRLTLQGMLYLDTIAAQLARHLPPNPEPLTLKT